MAKLVRLLSIDGGGIRGVIPATVLARIETLTGKPVSELFDLVAGTSTGGILALGLVKPGPAGRPAYTAEQMVSLYEKEGPRIFHRSVAWKLRALGGLAEEKYPSDGIEGVLDEYFGEARLKDSLSEIIITSYETERRIPFFFKSRNARVKPDYDFPMKAVARASSAAPTYFEPFKLETGALEEYFSLIDGGVYANNPAMCGYVEARATWPDATDFLVVSLGTGERTQPLPYNEIKGWGLANWAQPILSVVFDGVSSTVDYQLRLLLPASGEGRKRYWRFQTTLSGVADAMDDADPENVRSLKLLAEAMIREHTDDLDSLCATLVP